MYIYICKSFILLSLVCLVSNNFTIYYITWFFSSLKEVFHLTTSKSSTFLFTNSD